MYHQSVIVARNTRRPCYISKRAYSCRVREFWAAIFGLSGRVGAIPTYIESLPTLWYSCVVAGYIWYSSGVPLSLPGLLQLNVPQQIGIKYKEFGTLLLDDSTGNLVNNIERQCHQTPKDINTKILEECIAGRGKPHTWEKLIEVLRDCKLNALADHIQDCKCSCSI